MSFVYFETKSLSTVFEANAGEFSRKVIKTKTKTKTNTNTNTKRKVWQKDGWRQNERKWTCFCFYSSCCFVFGWIAFVDNFINTDTKRKTTSPNYFTANKCNCTRWNEMNTIIANGLPLIAPHRHSPSLVFCLLQTRVHKNFNYCGMNNEHLNHAFQPN